MPPVNVKVAVVVDTEVLGSVPAMPVVEPTCVVPTKKLTGPWGAEARLSVSTVAVRITDPLEPTLLSLALSAVVVPPFTMVKAAGVVLLLGRKLVSPAYVAGNECCPTAKFATGKVDQPPVTQTVPLHCTAQTFPIH